MLHSQLCAEKFENALWEASAGVTDGWLEGRGGYSEGVRVGEEWFLRLWGSAGAAG